MTSSFRATLLCAGPDLGPTPQLSSSASGAFLVLGPRVVSPHPQGLQGSHLNLSQTSAQRHRTYFLLNNRSQAQ